MHQGWKNCYSLGWIIDPTLCYLTAPHNLTTQAPESLCNLTVTKLDPTFLWDTFLGTGRGYFD